MLNFMFDRPEWFRFPRRWWLAQNPRVWIPLVCLMIAPLGILAAGVARDWRAGVVSVIAWCFLSGITMGVSHIVIRAIVL